MTSGKKRVTPAQDNALYKPVLLGVTTRSDFAKEEVRNSRSASRKKPSSVSKITKTTPRSTKSRKKSRTPTKQPVSNERKRSVVHQPAFMNNVPVSPTNVKNPCKQRQAKSSSGYSHVKS